MKPFNLQTLLAKIDDIGFGDNTDIDPKMTPTKPEAIADCKAFVERYALRLKSMPWVTPMTEGRIQLEFTEGERELEVEFDGKRVCCLAYSTERRREHGGQDALIDWLNREDASTNGRADAARKYDHGQFTKETIG